MPSNDFRETGTRSLRRGRVSTCGRIYLITFVTSGRKAWFSDMEAARSACRALVDPRIWTRSRLLAWVLMPDHWHGLIELGEEDLSRLVGRLKSNVARRVREAGRLCEPVWARGFHDRALRHEDDIFDVASYVIHNPVRAGLASTPSGYCHWATVWDCG
jgi:putative transposase